MSEARAPAPTLEVRWVSVRYGLTPAVDRASLRLDEAGILALLGPSGCGKTTLLRAIAGFEEPTSGQIWLGGEEVVGPGCWVEPERRQVGMVFQEGALFPQLTVRRNVLYGVRRQADGEERAMAALELVGLADLAERYPDELSGGQQQRVALARALAPSPRIVLLDEPFANLDAALRQRVREEVREILAAARATAVLVTHDQEEALSVADQVAVMVDGRILQVGPPEEIYRRPASIEVARFVGGGLVVPCEVRDRLASTAFGSAPCEARDGAGSILIRPEDLRLVDPQATTAGLEGELVRRRFFGHDMTEEVRLDDGRVVEARSLSPARRHLGSRVRVQLRDLVFRVFPDSAPTASATPDAAASLSEELE